ncbi:MAG: hypothetical protein WCQ81_01440, partial [Bacteroidales bacterium]
MRRITDNWPPKKSEEPDTALFENKGVAPLPSVNPYVKNFFKKKQKELTAQECLKGIFAGNTSILGRAITLVE